MGHQEGPHWLRRIVFSSLCIGVLTAIVLLVESWIVFVACAVAVAVFVFLLLHAPELVFQRLLGSLVGMWALSAAIPNVQVALELEPKTKALLAIESAGSMFHVCMILSIAFVAFCELVRQKGWPTNSPHPTGDSPSRVVTAGSLAQSNIIAGDNNSIINVNTDADVIAGLVRTTPSLIDKCDLQSARDNLEILKSKDGQLSSDQKCTLHICAARIKFREGKRPAAMAEFRQAETFAPTRAEQFAWIAMGYYLDAKMEKAKEWQERARVLDPLEPRTVMLGILLADSSTTASQLAKDVDQRLLKNPRVAVALGIRFRWEGKESVAEEHFLKTKDIDPNYAEPVFQLATQSLDSFIANELVRFPKPSARHTEQLSQPLAWAATALAIAERCGDLETQVRCHLLLTQMKCYCADIRGCEEHLRLAEALLVLPEEVTSAKLRFLHLSGQHTQAEEIAQPLALSEPHSELDVLAQTVLASSHDEARVQAATNKLKGFIHTLSQDVRKRALQLAAASSLIVRLIARKQFDEARNVLESDVGKQFDAGSHTSFDVDILRGQGRVTEAIAQLEDAGGRLDSTWEPSSCKACAYASLRVNRYDLAIRFFQAYILEAYQSPDALSYLEALKVVDDRKAIVSFCSAARSTGLYLPNLIHRELEALAELDPLRAREIIVEVVRKRPDDKVLRLIAGYYALRIGSKDSVQITPDVLPPATTIEGGQHGSLAVSVLNAHGYREEARTYAFELLHRFPADYEVHRAIISQIYIPHLTEQRPIKELAVVGPETAVRLHFSDKEEDAWVILEKVSSRIPNIRSWSLTSAEAMALIGKTLNAAVELPQGNGLPTKAVIKTICDKRDVLGMLVFTTFPKNFPDADDVVVFKVDEADPVGSIQRALAASQGIKNRDKQVSSLLAMYKRFNGPFIASMTSMGLNPIEAFVSITQSSTLKFVGNQTTEEAAGSLGSALQAAKTLVVSATTVLVLGMLGEVALIKRLRHRIVMGRVNFQSLREWSKSAASSGIVVFEPKVVAGGFPPVPAPNALRNKVEDLLSWIEVNGAIEPASDGVELDPKLRKETFAVLGRQEFETVVLSRKEGYMMWCDDALVAALGKQKFLVESVSTDFLIEHLLTEKLLSLEELVEIKDCLLANRYWFVRLQSAQMPYLLRRFAWNVQTPVAKGLALCLSDHSLTPEQVLKNFFAFVRGAVDLIVVEADVDRFTKFLLDAVAQRPNSDAIIEEIERAIEAVFRLKEFDGHLIKSALISWKARKRRSIL